MIHPPAPDKGKPTERDQALHVGRNKNFFVRTKKTEQFSINANHCRFWPTLLQKQFQLVELELRLTFASRFCYSLAAHFQTTQHCSVWRQRAQARPGCSIKFTKVFKSHKKKNVEHKINFNRVKRGVVFPTLIFLFGKQPCTSRNVI